MDELNKHYKDTAVKFDLLDIAPDIPFDLGNVIKYLIRAGDKESEPFEKDIDKAKVYARIHYHMFAGKQERYWSENNIARWHMLIMLLRTKYPELPEDATEMLLMSFVEDL